MRQLISDRKTVTLYIEDSSFRPASRFGDDMIIRRNKNPLTDDQHKTQCSRERLLFNIPKEEPLAKEAIVRSARIAHLKAHPKS